MSEKLKHHAKVIAISGIASIPVIGGAISVLVNEYLPSELEARRNRLLEQFDKDIEALKEQYKPDRLATPQYSTVFFKVFKNAIEEHDEDKIKLYRAILQNSARIDLSHNFEVEYFIRLVNELTISHIHILKLIHDEVFHSNVIYTPPGEKDLQDMFVADLEAKRLIYSDKTNFATPHTIYSIAGIGKKLITFITLHEGNSNEV